MDRFERNRKAMILHKTPAHDAAGDCSTCGGDPNKDFGDPSFPLACPKCGGTGLRPPARGDQPDCPVAAWEKERGK
jgi:hypothetical protein